MVEQSWPPDELLLNEQFLAWYKGEDHGAVKAWEMKMQADPSLAEQSARAKTFLDQALVREKGITGTQLARATASFRTTLQTDPQTKKDPVRRLWIRWAAAAILVISLGTGGWWFFQKEKTLEYATAYGESRSLTLPDGSMVMLNARSTVKYPRKFNHNKREIWITGEAYFDVKHLQQHTPFVVHTPGYDVKVKGTRFNVLARSERQQVMLAEGAVELSVKGLEAEELVPGDWITIRNSRMEKAQTDGRVALAWTEQQLIFEKVSLTEVAALIQEHYGVTVTVDPTVQSLPVSGIFPNNNLAILRETLSASREFRIEQAGKGLRIVQK